MAILKRIVQRCGQLLHPAVQALEPAPLLRQAGGSAHFRQIANGQCAKETTELQVGVLVVFFAFDELASQRLRQPLIIQLHPPNITHLIDAKVRERQPPQAFGQLSQVLHVACDIGIVKRHLEGHGVVRNLPMRC